MDKVRPEKGKGNLLVVDDDLNIRQTLEAFLKGEGYDVRCAPSGEMALMFAEKDPPDLILLDIRLPDIDGFEVCRRLKEGLRTGRIPVIFISGLEDVADKVKGFAAGGVDYVTKPFQSEELQARVETHLALLSMRKQIEAQNALLQQETAKSRQGEEALRKARDELEERVKQRTADLERAGERLQASLREVENLKAQIEKENVYLRNEFKLLYTHEEIIGQSEPIRQVLAQVEKVARTDSTVLITGKTGPW